jgi:hypothetical protein
MQMSSRHRISVTARNQDVQCGGFWFWEAEVSLMMWAAFYFLPAICGDIMPFIPIGDDIMPIVPTGLVIPIAFGLDMPTPFIPFCSGAS